MLQEACGVQDPVFSWVPEYASSIGVEAAEFCASAGLVLDPWQAQTLTDGLGVTDDGRWAAFEVGLVVSRQNGKGAILEARELVGLFLLEERLLIHSAHQFDTSLEAFRRLMFLIEDTPDLDAQVKRVSRSHGEEGVELKNGSRIRFRTRTKGGGRGFSSDCLILDEAMILPGFSHGALLPTLSARPNPQVWYTGSAVDQEIHEDGIVLSRIRQRGHDGNDPSLAYFEWSADAEGLTPDAVEESLVADLAGWARANPGLGIRIRPEHVEQELRSMDTRTFAVERLGIGDWPDTETTGGVLDLELWQELTDVESIMLDPICLAFDVSPARTSATISAAGQRGDGLAHVEVVEQREGTGWVASRLKALINNHSVARVVCDARSPAAALLHDLDDLGIVPEAVSSTDYGRACGLLVDTVNERKLRHLGTSELRQAIKGAKARELGDAFAWGRKKSAIDITPLVSVTLALWGAEALAPSPSSWSFG